MPLPAGEVALLLTDVVGSTAAWDADPVGTERAIALHDRVVGEVVAAAGGMVLRFKGEGDSTFSVFTDARQAVAAAVEVLLGLRSAGVGLEVRAGVHVGPITPRDGDYYGPVPNRAARLRGLAAPGRVLLSAAVVAAVGDRLPSGVSFVDLGRHALRGLREPEQVFGVSHPELAPPSVDGAGPPANLPAPVDEFVGRGDEVEALHKALDRHRLVTVVGFGGIGKTRLALEVAARRLAEHASGTWFVDVGALGEEASLLAAVAAVCGVAPEQADDPVAAIAAALPGPALLLLDTCEGRLEAAADVAAELLGGVPGLRVLATSREPLLARGEALVHLGPLKVGGEGVGLPSEAARLFLARADAADLAGAAARDLGAVERLCALVDGIPLAVELLAARTADLDLDEIESSLAATPVGAEGAIAVRRGGPRRHRSLAAAIAWTHASLSEVEQAVLRRLACFVAGWPDTAAAAAVAAGPPVEADDVAGALAVLEHRSLVRRLDGRAGLYDPVRSFAAERLAEAGEAAAVAARHQAWALATAERLEADPSLDAGPEAQAELPNLRAGLLHALEVADADVAQRLVYAMARTWEEVGAFAELEAMGARALALGGGGDARAAALAARALVVGRTGKLDDARRLIDEARTLIAGRTTRAAVETWLVASFLAADQADRRALSEEAVRVAEAHGDPDRLANALHNLAASLRRPEDHRRRVEVMARAAVLEASADRGHFARLGEAAMLVIDGRPAEALRRLAQLEDRATGPLERCFLLQSRIDANLTFERHDAALADADELAQLAERHDLPLEAAQARASAARALVGLGRPDEALDRLGPADDATAGAVDPVEHAIVLLALDRPDEAARVAPPDPDSVPLAVALGRHHLRQGDADAVLAAIAGLRRRRAAHGLADAERELLAVEVAALELAGDPSAAEARDRLDELAARAAAAAPRPAPAEETEGASA